MKRDLNSDEKEICEKQLKRHKENLKKLKESYEYNIDVIQQNKKQRDFETKWANYKRRLKEDTEKNTLGVLDNQIKDIEEHIKQLTHDLKFGVEKMSGV